MAVVMMMAAGCSKEDSSEESRNNMAKFTIDMEQVSILVGDDYKVTPSGKFTARSTDEDVAAVSAEGVIHGVSAGDADIIFTSTEDGQTQTCKVSVDWKYKYFDEPILDFGASVEDIKARETRKLKSEDRRQGFILSWDEQKRVNHDLCLNYGWKDAEVRISPHYYFSHDTLVAVFCRIESPIDDPYDIKDKLVRQLTERYDEPTGYRKVSNFSMWKWDASTFGNGQYEVYNFDFASITYLSIL